MDRRLVILVEFELHAGKELEFRRLVLENAAASLRDEPGCRQFDVLTPEGGPGEPDRPLRDLRRRRSVRRASRHPAFRRLQRGDDTACREKTVHRLGFAAPP